MSEACDLHSVCELHSFRSDAFSAGMDEEDIARLVSVLSKNPQAGEVMQGTGGCRKLRFSRKNTGKSGAFRTVTFFGGGDLPVFLITAFSKGEKANLTKGERNELAKLTKILVETYRGRVVKVGVGA